MTEESFNRPVRKKDFIGLGISIVIGGAVASFFIYHGLDALPHLVLGVAAFYGALALGVCLHELGHALAAVSVGGHVRLIQLGRPYKEWKPWIFHFAGFLWQINSAPFSGWTHASFNIVHRFRLRNCWMILCGPLANLILLFVGWLAIQLWPTSDYRACLIGWCSAQAYLVVISTIPRHASMLGQRHATDGLLFYKTLRYTDQDVLRIVQIGDMIQKLDAPALDLVPPAELKARHETSPSDLAILYRLTTLLTETNDPQYATYALKLISHPELPSKMLPELIDVYLTWQLHHGPPDQPEQADQLSIKLLALTDSISTRGTRGSTLIDLGRLSEGRDMLNEVLAKTESSLDKAYAHVFLALAAKAENNTDLARKHAAEARRIDAALPVINRVSDLLPA